MNDEIICEFHEKDRTYLVGLLALAALAIQAHHVYYDLLQSLKDAE
jgi:hypothetical protein